MALSRQNIGEQASKAEEIEMNGKNLKRVNCQMGNDDHSASQEPLIRYADNVVFIIKHNERYSSTDTQKAENHSSKRFSKQQQVFFAIAVLAVILVIVLISIILLLIEREVTDPRGSMVNEVVDGKENSTKWLIPYLSSFPNGSLMPLPTDHAATIEPIDSNEDEGQSTKTTAISTSRSHLNDSSPPDLINFIRNGLNSSISPCQDFYAHVCSNHNSTSDDLLKSQFYGLIMPAINNDTNHPEVAKTLLHFVEECAKVNGSKKLQQHLVLQNMNSLNLPPFRSLTVDKNFNFIVPLVRILFHSPRINVNLLHKIFDSNNTVAFYGDPEDLPATRRNSTLENNYNHYLSVFNLTKNEEELTTLQNFMHKFQLICAESIINGSVSNIEIKDVRNAHFKQALEKMLPYLFRFDLNITAISRNFQVSVDQLMIESLQQLFANYPSEGLLFLQMVAYSAFNEPIAETAMDSMDSLRQICFYMILSEERFAIFNTYAAHFVQRSHFPMTQDLSQFFIRNITEKIRKTVREKLLATAWSLTDKESAKTIERLMAIKLIIGLQDAVGKNDVEELDRFEISLSLHNGREDTELLVHLANARLQLHSKFYPYFTINAWYDGEAIELSYLYLQRPAYADQFPESYNYGFMGYTIGHELFHQFSPKRIAEFWLNNTRYDQSVDCFVEFYDGICFNLTHNSDVSNTTKMHEVCAKGLTDRDENIPDVEGARVAFETMKLELGGEKLKERAMPEFDYTNEQLFFVAVAQDYCDKDLNDHHYLASDLLNEDPHASGNVRVNAIARQMVEFAEAFQCQPGDPMVTADEDKCYLLPAV